MPSGNVASTWTSWIISAMPSITSVSPQDGGPVTHQVRHGTAIARAFDDLGHEDRHCFGIIELEAPGLPSPSEVRGDDEEQLFLFAW